jgi:hypothetical protein
MRLTRTSSIAAVAVLAVGGTAVAAGTHTRSANMKATVHLTTGKLKVTTTNKPNGKNFSVRIDYDVMVKSKTVMAFFAYPCQSNKCTHFSTSRITLGTGHRLVTFRGTVPIVTRQKNGKTVACVFAHLRDQGPNGKKPGKIVYRSTGAKGVTLCAAP